MTNEVLQRQVKLKDNQHHVHVGLRYKTDPPSKNNAAVLAYSFYDQDETPLDPVGKFFSSKKFGPFVYLHSTNNAVTEFSGQFECPKNATAFEMRIYPWAPEVSFEVVEEPIIHLEDRDPESKFESTGGSPSAVPIEKLTLRYSVTPGVDYTMKWEIEAPEHSQALIIIRYLDFDGNENLPGSEFPIHPDHGAYQYAVGKDGSSLQELFLRIPIGVSEVEIKGIPWKKKGIRVLSRPSMDTNITKSARLADAEIIDYLRDIPSSEKVVVVYTTAGSISLSNSLLLRSNRLALEYAKAGWHVVFFPFSELKDDDSEIVGEKVVQFSPSRLSLVMDELLSRRGENNVLLCSSFTDLTMVGLLDRCHHHGWRVIYEVRDDMEEFKRVGFSKWYDPNLEARFAKRADALLAVSPRLKSKMEVLTGRNDVVLVPNGAPDELISEARPLRTPQVARERSNHNKIGYIGHLTASWFDWPWLFACAQQLPHVNFEIIGHGMPLNFSLPPNIKYLGAKNHSECLSYVEKWSAGLIPFKVSRLTYGVDPNKAYEYVAMGLRTVSAPMGQVKNMPGALTYTSQKEMASAIQWAIENPITEEELSEYEAYLKTSSWGYRSRTMVNILEGGAQ